MKLLTIVLFAVTVLAQANPNPKPDPNPDDPKPIGCVDNPFHVCK
jgi:hypothetical protein